MIQAEKWIYRQIEWINWQTEWNREPGSKPFMGTWYITSQFIKQQKNN